MWEGMRIVSTHVVNMNMILKGELCRDDRGGTTEELMGLVDGLKEQLNKGKDSGRIFNSSCCWFQFQVGTQFNFPIAPLANSLVCDYRSIASDA
jgi:hypothetical protein